MIALFKQKSPANTIILLLFGLLIKLPMLLHPQELSATPADGKLYHWFISLLPEGDGRALAGAALAFFLLYIQALMVMYIINEYRMTTRPTYLPGMAYLLITSLLPEWNYPSASLVASTLIIWSCSKLFRIYNVETANGTIYNTGLVVGIASFCYFPSIFFALFLLPGLMILRPFRLNEIFLCFAGIATPYYFYAIYLFLTDRFSLQNLFPDIAFHLPGTPQSLWLVAATLFLCIPFFMGGFYIQNHLRKMLIQIRKNWSIVLLYLLIALLIPFINGTKGFENWILTAAPFAAFHAYAFLHAPRKWAPLLFWLMVLLILSQQYFYPLLQGAKVSQ